GALLMLLAGAGRAAGATPAGAEFFEKKVRPVLAAHCFPCHSTGKKQRGHLTLDSRAGLLKGGDTGPAVLPGHPERSLLVKAIGYKDEPRMPPRSKLADEHIADLTAWVRMGAPWPDGDGAGAAAGKPPAFDLHKRRQHWAFQPIRRAAVPAVKRAGWARSPLDRFVL